MNDVLTDTLHRYWGYDDFRGIQRKIIESIFHGCDTLGLMPTGGGKSLTFQIPTMAREGLCIVITPLIALMVDQVDALHSRGIKATKIHSGMSGYEISMALDNCIFGGYKFLYVAPERLSSELFCTKVQKMKVNLIAVDEAHCISQWGHDFRPSYRQIVQIRKLLPGIPVLALTATATEHVTEDIQQQLGFTKRNVIRMSFERKNLHYIVQKTDDKNSELLSILKFIEGPAIIYLRNRERTKLFAEWLTGYHISSTYFHAGLSSEDKSTRQRDWQNGKIRVMVATSAFGMGIDKADVRLVVHPEVPDCLEEYFQEAGRAGRDGKTAYAILLYNKNDHSVLIHRLNNSYPEHNVVQEIYNDLCYHLEIAIGVGIGIRRSFDINLFCKTFKWQREIVIGALNLLQAEGWLIYNKEGTPSSLIHMIMSRENLYTLNLSTEEEQVLRNILRTGEGIFSRYCRIDENHIGEQIGLSGRIVYQNLIQLDRQGVLDYIPRGKMPEICFTRVRVEGKRITLKNDIYKERKLATKERLDAVWNYISTKDVCRSRMLLDYFGEHEKIEDCGTCDVCSPNIYGESKDCTNEIITLIRSRGCVPIQDLYFPGRRRENIGDELRNLVANGSVIIKNGKIFLA